MTEFTLNDGELVDENGDVVADETAVAIASVLVSALQKYENGRALFIEDREVRKTNGASPRLIIEKVSRVVVDDETRDAYNHMMGDFIEAFHGLQEKSAGVIALLFADCQKGGRLHDYLIGEATDISSNLKLVGNIPTIEELQKMATKVRGLWTSLAASVDSIDAIKALGVPCEVTNKGRADGTTYVVSMRELPKIKTPSTVDEIAVLKCDGKEIWRSGTDLTMDNSLSLLKIKPADFHRTMQLSEKIDEEGNKVEGTQQDIWSINFTLDKHHFVSERVKVS